MHVLDFNEKLHNQSLREEGYEAGLEIGREEGRKDGITTGRMAEKSDMIRIMLNIGRTPQEISDFCSIPLDTILDVQKSINA